MLSRKSVPGVSRTWSDAQVIADPEVIPIIELVSLRMGLAFSPVRVIAVEKLLRRARSDAGAADWEAYHRLLIADSDAFDALAGMLTVDESYFFRDRAQFEFLRRECVPALASQPGLVRVWSAGCAGGQEPFSLAIVCAESGIADRAQIVGTDLSGRRIAFAARGRYSRWSLRGVPEDLVQRHFDPVDVRLELKPAIRRAVEFRQLNLADPAAWRGAPREVDLLLCRNVLIYLQPDAIRLAAQELIASLSDRGWLLLGASDPPIADYTNCRVELTEAGLAYRKPGRRSTPIPSHPMTKAPGVAASAVPRKSPGAQRRETPPAPEPPTTSVVRSLADRGLLTEAIDACVGGLRKAPTSTELACLYSTLLSQAGRHAEAAAAARRALYLDRSLVLGHVALGMALARTGDPAGAIRSLRTARDLMSTVGDDALLPAGGGERTARVRAAVVASLDLLEAS